MNTQIESKKADLISLFQEHKIKTAYVFGSAASDKMDEESDIDFLVSFEDNLDPLENGQLWWSLYDALRQLFDRKVDLVIERSLTNPYFIQSVERSKKLIYG